MATALGITRSAYSNYESGEREMPYNITEKASNLFGCEMNILFENNNTNDALILASAFRLNGIEASDADEIIRFKDIVKSYIKMGKIEAR